MDVLSCPTCRSIDWYRDGVVISVGDDGEAVARRTDPPNPESTASAWSCMQCGHELPKWAGITKALNELEHWMPATEPTPAS